MCLRRSHILFKVLLLSAILQPCEAERHSNLVHFPLEMFLICDAVLQTLPPIDFTERDNLFRKFSKSAVNNTMTFQILRAALFK